MKLGSYFKEEDGRIYHVEQWDAARALKEAEYLRHMKEAKGGKLLDFAHGEVVEPKYCYPPWLEQIWSQRWGVKQDDEAFESIVQLELQSGEYERFRL